MSVPNISQLYPSQGVIYGYTSIMVSGTNLSGVNGVYFLNGQTQIPAITYNIFNDTSMNIVSPPLTTPLGQDGTTETKLILSNGVGSSSNTNINAVFTYSRNPIYVGLQYAMTASGGFVLEEGFPKIKLISAFPINRYDVTNALQVIFDVRKFNSLLGLIKDANNQYIISSQFDTESITFPNDDITLTSLEFVNGLSNVSQIISVGTFYSLYSDFNQSVNNYFSYGGFTPQLISGCIEHEKYDLSRNGIFGPAQFFRLLTALPVNANNVYVATVTGSITIHKVNDLLTTLVTQNIYHNRNMSGGVNFYPSDGDCYGLQDGFIDGDLVYVPDGISITLDLQIYSAPANFQTFVSSNPNFNNGYDYTSKYSDEHYTCSSNINMNGPINDLRQTITAPLLITLKNLTTDPYYYDPGLRP